MFSMFKLSVRIMILLVSDIFNVHISSYTMFMLLLENYIFNVHVSFCPRFMMVLICLIFSVLSTIDQYTSFANETLFWMVRINYTNSLVGIQSFLCKVPPSGV